MSITIGFSTRKTNPEFVDYLKKSSGFKKIEVIEKVNNGEKSLSEVYNEILNESSNDIVVLCHDDIYFDTSSWYHKIIKHFEKSDYGILGVAGTTYLPKSGQWWEQRKKMHGIVNHEHQGKKWTSKYSEDLGKKIKEVIVVDGLFIVLSKAKIKHKFDESVEGFHFYDLNFCFPNYLDGVKIGVIFDVRITHKSIGATNDQWEINRVKFSEKYSENLPVKLPIDPNIKLKVLIGCLFFRDLTGSELYVYELAKNLINMNCDVTIISQIGGPLTDMAKKIGIKCVSFEQAPGFKIGDGIWQYNNGKEVLKSEPKVMYKVSDVNFDIIHIQHKPVAQKLCDFYPDIDKIYSIHSEIIELENPIKHPSIKKYIAIRPEIKNHIVNNFEIPEEMVEVIYNPIDNEKFKPTQGQIKSSLLFVGTIDYLRRETIMDLLDYTKQTNKELWLMGEDKSNYLPTLQEQPNVKYFKPSWNVESLINQCEETAGIQLGRTTIESWMCGKPSWIYKVNSFGVVESKEKFEPPHDLEKFYSKNVSSEIKKEYLKILL